MFVFGMDVDLVIPKSLIKSVPPWHLHGAKHSRSFPILGLDMYITTLMDKQLGCILVIVPAGVKQGLPSTPGAAAPMSWGFREPHTLKVLDSAMHFAVRWKGV